MIGYILMSLGAYLVVDDYIKARAAKRIAKGIKGVIDGEIVLENGNVRGSGNRDSKPSANGKESDRNRRIKPFPVTTQGGKNDISEKPIQQSRLNQVGSGAGDNSSSQPDATPKRGQAKGVTEVPVETGNHKGEGGSNESNLENGISNDGDDVDLELSGGNESDSPKTD